MALKRKTEVMRLRYEKCISSRVYKEPFEKVNDYYLEIERIIKTLENSCIKKIKDSRIDATKLISKLDALSPLKTLTRGYTLAEVDGKVVTKKEQMKKDMEFDLNFQDGKIHAKVL